MWSIASALLSFVHPEVSWFSGVDCCEYEEWYDDQLMMMGE